MLFKEFFSTYAGRGAWHGAKVDYPREDSYVLVPLYSPVPRNQLDNISDEKTQVQESDINWQQANNGGMK